MQPPTNFGAPRLGYGDTRDVGRTPDWLPRDAGDVDVGGPVQQLALGARHTCALLMSGDVRCWGSNDVGQLGSGIPGDIVGDDETPASRPPVQLVGAVKDIAAYRNHTCALLADDERLHCWGEGGPHLGRGDLAEPPPHIGDDETPLEAGALTLAMTTADVSVGARHSCVLSALGDVHCWGRGAYGQLGYGSTVDVSMIPEKIVELGSTVFSFDVGAEHACSLHTDRAVRCWGRADDGRLGYGDVAHIGDDANDEFSVLALGGDIERVVAGGVHSCAVRSTGALLCWGSAVGGRLGHGGENIGDDETPAEGPVTAVIDAERGERVARVAVGENHTCVLVAGGGQGMRWAVRCFGIGASGALGYGGTETIGDDEEPLMAGNVPLL